MSLSVPAYQIEPQVYTPQGFHSGRVDTSGYQQLTAHDAEVLRVRGIPPHIARENGLRSVTAREARSYGHRPLPGLLIPNYNTQGEIDRHQLRPHMPPIDRETGKPRKYLWPAGKSQSLYVPPASLETLRDIAAPLIITEAPLKALATLAALEAEGITGVAVIAVAGVTSWRSGDMPLSDHNDIPMKRMKRDRVVTRRRVLIAFDSDAATNPEVIKARWEYTQYLRRKRARVEWINVPAVEDDPNPATNKQGIDDALAAGIRIGELISAAIPAPDIMPTFDEARIAPESAGTLEDELQYLRAKVARLEADNRALVRLIKNPYLKPTDKTWLVSAGTEVLAAASRGEVDDQGRVRLDKGRISQDWRRKPKQGEAREKVNPDGSLYLMPRSSVPTTGKRLRDMGLISFEEAPDTVRREDGTTYHDNMIFLTPPQTLADLLNPAAHYVPEDYQPRADYTKPERCVHCGEIHGRTIKVTRETYCGTADDPGCGAMIKSTTTERTVPVPLAGKPELSDDERAELDAQVRGVTKNVTNRYRGEAGEPEPNGAAPVPAPTYSLATKNVTPQSESGIRLCASCGLPRSGDERPCPSCRARGSMLISPGALEATA